MPRSRPASEGFDDALANELFRETDTSEADAQARKSALIRARCTPPQLALIQDRDKRKAARCPRRAGKTTAALLLLADFFATHAGATAWYIATTLKSARKLTWNALKRLNRELSLGVTFHKTDAQITWPNESQLWLAGADDESSINELLGHAPSIVVIDECAAFQPSAFSYLLYDVLEPSLMDNEGTLLLISTPGVMLSGLFYEITGPTGTEVQELPDGKHVVSRPYRERRARKWRGVGYEWSLHTWTLEENVARPDLWRKSKALKERKGWSSENPIWRRQYLGEWTEADASLRVFTFDEARDTWEPELDEHGFAVLPAGHRWRAIIGMDLGSYDPFAIQVAFYSETSPLILHAYEWEAPKLTFDDVGAKLTEVIEHCGGWDNVEEMVADHEGLGDMVLASLLEQYGLAIEKADKKNKRDHIELTNGELKDGRCKIIKGSRLASEMARLQWDEKRPAKTKSGVPNNNTDAFLYLSTRARTRNSRERTVMTSDEKQAALQQAEAAAFVQRTRRKPELQPRLDVQWEPEPWDM